MSWRRLWGWLAVGTLGIAAAEIALHGTTDKATCLIGLAVFAAAWRAGAPG